MVATLTGWLAGNNNHNSQVPPELYSNNSQGHVIPTVSRYDERHQQRFYRGGNNRIVNSMICISYLDDHQLLEWMTGQDGSIHLISLDVPHCEACAPLCPGWSSQETEQSNA